MTKRILLVGGGTGGHVFPLVAVAQELQKQAQQQEIEIQIQMLGDGDFLHQAARDLGVVSHQVSGPKWRRYFSPLNFLDIFKIPLGIAQALFFVWFFMPDVVFAKGGYASFLPVIVARMFGIPVYIHESDSVAGRTTRFLAGRSRLIFLAFDEAQKFFPQGKTLVVGNPIRSEFLSMFTMQSSVARQSFDLASDLPTFFVGGSSQGAQPINEILFQSLAEIVKDFQVIHQCGKQNFDALQKKLNQMIQEGGDGYGQQIKQRYRIFGTMKASELAHAYAAADVVVSRASSAIFEIAAFGKPMVLIPLPQAANDHQRSNANEFAKSGALIIEQSNLTPHILIHEIKKAFEQKESVSESLRHLSPLDAAEKIAQILLG